MIGARTPYADDSYDGDPAGAAIAVARARLATADQAYRKAVYWMRTAVASNRAARAAYLEKCTRAALEAAAALRALGGLP